MLTDHQIILNPIKKEDLPFFQKWMSDPEITQYLRMFRPLTEESEEEWFHNLVKDPNQTSFSINLIQEDQSERLIGNCGITIDWRNRFGHLGISIGDKSCWGKGYGTEALQLLTKYAFDTLNLNRMELEVYDFNDRGIACYKKVGFVEEGRRRNAAFINGSYHDVIIMGLLREEWSSQ